MLNGFHVGYISKGRTKTVRQLVDNSPHRLVAFITGGPRYEKRQGKRGYAIVELDFSIRLHILTGSEDELADIPDLFDYMRQEGWKYQIDRIPDVAENKTEEIAVELKPKHMSNTSIDDSNIYNPKYPKNIAPPLPPQFWGYLLMLLLILFLILIFISWTSSLF